LAAKKRVGKKTTKALVNKQSAKALLASSKGRLNVKKSVSKIVSQNSDDSVGKSTVLSVVSIAVICGTNNAELHLNRYSSSGKCVLFNDEWYSPQEFETLSGHGAARDWKHTIKHSGQSIKTLLISRVLTLTATRHRPVQCRCERCLTDQQVQVGDEYS
jgi:hypothetical protein